MVAGLQFCLTLAPALLSDREKIAVSMERSTKDGPFCWQSKAALRRIRDVAGESNKPSPASVIAVYTGLCELASDSQAGAFEASRGHIAGKACVHVKTADAALRLLVKCELLRIERRRIDETTNLPSVYRLLPYGSEIKPPGSELKHLLGKRQDSLTTAHIMKNLTEDSEESIAPAGAPDDSENKPSPKAVKPRARDPLLDALATLGGNDPAQVTGKAWGAIGKALKEIREVCPGVTEGEINRRAGNYRQHMPGAMLTAPALAKHWATCDRPPQSALSNQQPARDYPAFAK